MLRAVLLPVFVAALCLDGGIPVHKRRNLTYDGYNGPVLDMPGSWASAKIVSETTRILIEEVLGYHYGVPNVAGSSAAFAMGPSGCKNIDAQCTGCSECADQDEHHPESHMGLEGWYPGQRAYDKLPPTRRALELTKHTYQGYEGMYSMRKPIDLGYAHNMVLVSHMGWNSTKFPAMLTVFDDLETMLTNAAFTATRVKDLGINADLLANPYTDVTGDVGPYCYNTSTGVLTMDAAATCEGDAWVTPACRADPKRCIPYITTSGWGHAQIVQYAFFYGMPLVILDVPWGEYVERPLQVTASFFYWTPDATFMKERATLINFPPHNPTEHARKVYKTAGQATGLAKYVWRWMEKADKGRGKNIVHVLDRLSIYDVDINQMLEEVAYGVDIAEVTCTFLRGIEDRWRSWVPSSLHHCGTGEGIGAAGTDACAPCDRGHRSVFDSNRNNFVCAPGTPGTYCPEAGKECIVCPEGAYCLEGATAPTLCPVGASSPRTGANASAACSVCLPGSYAPKEGTQSCVPCPRGFLAEAVGARECRACPAGTYVDTEGQAACTACSAEGLLTTLAPGSTSADACVCSPETFLQNGACVACLEGLACMGGNGPPTVQRGYYTPDFAAGQTYRCKAGACPGGGEAACAPGRTGVACGRCKEGFHASAEHGCAACAQSDRVGIAVVIVLFLFCGLSVLTFAFAVDPKSMPLANLSSGFALGMGFGMIQVLQAFNSLALEWHKPFSDVLAVVRLVAFELDVVQGECVMGSTALSRYVPKIVALPLICAWYTAIVFLTSFVLRKFVSQLQEDIVSKPPTIFAMWSNGVGTLAFVFFISLAIVSAQPFECVSHPGDVYTLARFMDVICGDAYHDALVGGGIAGVVQVVTIIGSFAATIWLYPSWILRCANYQLMCSRFLFIRFSPRHYYFSIVLLLRNTAIAFTPALAEFGGMQIIMIIIFVLAYNFIQTVTFPWRLYTLNILDQLLSITFLVILGIGAVFIPWVTGDREASVVGLQGILMTAFVAMSCTLVAFSISRVARKHRKRYSLFVSHQKSDAGASARWVQLVMGRLLGDLSRVFIDSDNLVDLDTLLTTVQGDVQAVLVLVTADTLWRPWCVGEICMAVCNKVPIALCAFPGTHDIILTAADNVANKLPPLALEILQPFFIGVDCIASVYRSFPSMPLCHLDVKDAAATSMPMFEGLLASLGLKQQGTHENHMHRSSTVATAAEVVILVNDAHGEAVGTSRIVTTLMQEEGVLVFNAADTQRSELAVGKSVLVLLTAGVMAKGHVAAVLVLAFRASTPCLPMAVEGMGFAFPTQETYDSLLAGTLLAGEEWEQALALCPTITLAEVKDCYHRLLQLIAPLITPLGGLDTLRQQCSYAITRLTAAESRRPVGQSLVGAIRQSLRLPRYPGRA